MILKPGSSVTNNIAENWGARQLRRHGGAGRQGAASQATTQGTSVGGITNLKGIVTGNTPDDYCDYINQTGTCA